MLIRPATKNDVPALALLQQKLFEEKAIYGFAPDDAEQIENAINDYFLVAETGNKIDGFINGKTFVAENLAVVPNGAICLEIENLYVAPESRRKGIGGSLIEELLAKAKTDGIEYSTLYSATKNARDILKFYERHKFQSWYVQMFQKL